MRRSDDQRVLIAVLVSASILTYVVHYLVFRDIYHIFYYGIMDVAFTPISVLLVTLVINRLLSERDRRAMLSKLDMVIGVFFTELGTDLLRSLSTFDAAIEDYHSRLAMTGNWTPERFKQEARDAKDYRFQIDVTRGDLGQLRSLLHDGRRFLLSLLENPNLLEHETFTELLLAVTHVGEELDHRDSLSGLPASDCAHLSGDVLRAYKLLIREWLTYMDHLRTNYPYLFSLAIRTNPFNANARVTVAD